jgi:thioesterase domain-containing protein
MTPSELQHYLHQHIPLSLAMQVSVADVAPHEVLLCAPLAPNINHMGTVFGGSASTLAILAAWALLQTRLDSAGIAAHLVIQRNTMAYELPMAGSFSARAFIPAPGAWDAFTRMLQRKGRARIIAASVLECGGQATGHFEGEFVALGAKAV